MSFDWSKLIHGAVDFAEQLHPTSPSGTPTGPSKLASAVTIVQAGVGIAAALGIIPAAAAINTQTIIEAINAHVASVNAQAKAPKSPAK